MDAAGQSTRLFNLFRGTHWSLLGYQVERESVQPRPELHIHIFGATGDVFDDRGHFQDAYDLTVGDWVLVRPDGYIGAIVTGADIETLEAYLARVGLGDTITFHRSVATIPRRLLARLTEHPFSPYVQHPE